VQAYESEVYQLIFSEGAIIAFLNSIEKGIIIVDIDETILFINKKAQCKLGKTFNEVRGKSINKLIGFANIQKVLADGISYSNYPSKKEEGSIYIDACTLEINRNIIGAVMVLKEPDDNTDYVNTLKISRSISKELETIYNSSCDEIFVTDDKGVVVKVSAFYENLYDLNRNNSSMDFIGMNVRDLERSGVFNPSVSLIVLREKKRVSITQQTNSGKGLMVTG